MSATCCSVVPLSREESAEEVVLRRRMQNRLSQQRSRERMRSRKAAIAGGAASRFASTSTVMTPQVAPKTTQAFSSEASASPHSSHTLSLAFNETTSSSSASSSSPTQLESASDVRITLQDAELQTILDAENIAASGSTAKRTLDHPLEAHDTLAASSLVRAEMQTPSFVMALKARTFVDAVPHFLSAFGIPLDVAYDKFAAITFSPTFHDYDCTNEASYTSMFADGLIKSAWSDKPRTMMPTTLQLGQTHPLCVAIGFPWPSFRDRMIRKLQQDASLETRVEFCKDLQDGVQIQGERWQPSMLVWGDDVFNPDNWEVCRGFMLKYAELFEPLILQRTNWWREQRNLPPIILTANAANVMFR